jgi:hypothetical protein
LFSSCTKLEITNSYKQEPRNKNVSLKRIEKINKKNPPNQQENYAKIEGRGSWMTSNNIIRNGKDPQIKSVRTQKTKAENKKGKNCSSML